MKVVAENRKAHHDFFIEDSLEAGLVLTGTEVKSLRQGRATLRESHAAIDKGEAYLYNMHIAIYEHGNRYNHDPYRRRKLLLHKEQIDRLFGVLRERGYSLVPLRLYFDEKGRAKMQLGVGRGKKQYDKRHELAARDARREIERALRGKE